MSYVDGFVLAVESTKREEYTDFAKKYAHIFKEFGALSVVETWGVDVPEGKLTSFPMAVQCKENETVVFSWIVWPSKEVRDIAWGKMEESPLFDPVSNPMPFDGKRMIFGGFEKIVDA